MLPVSSIPISIHVVIADNHAALLQGLRQWQAMGLLIGTEIPGQTTLRKTDQQALQLTIKTQMSPAELLHELEHWLDSGWLGNAEICCDVQVNASHPNILEGLDYWLQLGLLTENKVKNLCSNYFSCPIPPVIDQLQSPVPQTPALLPSQRLAPAPIARVLKPSLPKPASQLRQVMQSLMAELSVLWLLLLGIFLVVISSGVLAASQWQSFPAILQYGILGLYTLGFWGASFWAERRPHLSLTAQALRMVTLLLIPLNFSAMDSFRLWNSLPGCLVMVVAGSSLLALMVNLWPSQNTHRITLPMINVFGLCCLQWGWSLPGMPLGATYLGVVGTAIMTVYPFAQGENAQICLPSEPSTRRPLLLRLQGALILYALVLLMIRAIFIAQVEIAQLGFAIAICGHFITKERYHLLVSMSGEKIGGSLIGLGWILSVGSVPWQAFLSSGLGLLFFRQRLAKKSLKLDLIGLWLIGLQMFGLAWRLIPQHWQQGIITAGMALTGIAARPWPLLSLGLFPYLIITVWLANSLAQRQQKRLAQLGGWLSLVLGSSLTLLSLGNPGLRMVNGAGSTLLLAFMTQREGQRSPARNEADKSTTAQSLGIMTHLGCLLTLSASLNYVWPTMSLVQWAIFCLGLMLTELWLSLRPPPSQILLGLLWNRVIRWGMGLGGVAYGLLGLNQIAQGIQNGSIAPHLLASTAWGLIWGITPVTLTAIAIFVPRKRRYAIQCSVGAVILLQGLTFFVPEIRLWGLSLATVLMLVNTPYWTILSTAVLTIGFTLALGIDSLYQSNLLMGQGFPAILLLGTGIIGLLWLLRHRLTARTSALSAIYAQALDIWAIALTSLELIVLLTVRLADYLRFSDLLAFAAANFGLILLSAYRTWQPRHQAKTIWLSMGVLLLGQLPLVAIPSLRVIGLAIAVGLMFFQTQRLESIYAALITVGLTLGLGSALLTSQSWALPPLSLDHWLLLSSGAILLLWGLRPVFASRGNALSRIYAQACDFWGIGLCGLELVGLTLHSLLVYWNLIPASLGSMGAAGLTLGAITYRFWREPNNVSIYGIGWSLELLTLEVLGWTGRSLVALAIANIVLGLITQQFGNWWHQRSGQAKYLASWHLLPLLYGALGASLRWGFFSRWSGLTTLGLVLIALGVGRRRSQFKSLLYLGIIGISLSAYELLFYQVKGLGIGDQLLAMVALTTSIMYMYRLLSPRLSDYLGLSPLELKKIAHIHWGLGTVLFLTAIVLPTQINALVGLGAGFFLARYALWQGRRHPSQQQAETWVYIGIVEAAATGAYATTIVPNSLFIANLFLPFAGIITALVGAILYLLPWSVWGWPERPWQRLAVIFPLAGLLPNLQNLSFYPLNFLGVAGFYAGLAYRRHQPRISYLSVILIDGIIAQSLLRFSLDSPLAYAGLLGLSIFFIATIDPFCRTRAGKTLRHQLRMVGMGIISGIALLYHYQTGIIPGLLGIITIFMGLSLRIRAFLFVGTATFLAIVLYQLVILILDYPLLKWLVGLFIGLTFIWIAATFETRRSQFSVLVRNWLTDFENWD